MKFATTALALLLTLVFAPANEIADSQKKWISVYKKQKNIPAPADMLINTDAEPNLKKGFVSLYNGKDIDNWVPRGGHCKFEAKGKTIVGTTVKGSPSTYLSTKKDDYTDFIFSAELKWEVDGNTGVMFRAASKSGSGKNKETVFGPQAEMEAYSKERYWSGGIYGQSAGGWIYPMWLDAHDKTRKAMKPKGSWNRITIQAKGDTIKTWLNGVPAAHWKTDLYKQGFFSLQIHSGKEGTVHFRNLKVKELK